LIVGVTLILVMVAVRKARFQSVQLDPRGNVIPVLDIVKSTVTDPDSNPNYRSHTADDLLRRLVELYLEKKYGYRPDLPAITDKRQDLTKERDQMLDLATRGLPGSTINQKRLPAPQLPPLLMASSLESRFKILNDTSDLDVIDADVIKVLDNDWKEGTNK
jgi:hypothetical protein